MTRAASLAYRGVTLTLSSASILTFLAFDPNLYLASLMTTDMTGKALSQRIKHKATKPSHTLEL